MKLLDKNQEKILFFTWCLIILTCLLVIFTSPVKAESPSNLPYYVNQNVPFEVPFTFEQVVDGAFNNPNYNITGTSGLSKDDVLNCENYLLIVNYYNPTYISFTYHILIVDNYNISLSNNNYDSFVPGTDIVNLTFNGYSSNLGKYITLSVVWNPEVYTWQNAGYGYNGVNTVKVFNSNNNYPLNYPFAIKKDFVIGNDNLPVLANFSEPVNVTGHATPPINDQGHYIPNVNPQHPTITPYQPSSPQFPSIDTSTLETLVESLIDVVEYGFNWIGGVISGAFSNLLSNIDSLFDYIVQSFNRGFNNVVGAIQDLATDFYNNMLSLFEPLYEFLNGIATFFNNLIQLGLDGDSFSLSTFFYNLLVPDPEDFADALLDGDVHHVVPLVSSVHTKFVSLFNSFSNLTPSKVLLIPSFTWHGQTFNLSIDFSWYDDYKVYGDTIISGFLIIGYIYWFVLQLSSMFRGGNSIGHDVAKVGGQH